MSAQVDEASAEYKLLMKKHSNEERIKENKKEDEKVRISNEQN